MKEHSLQDIINYTGLKPDFLRKAIKELEQILNPYTARGDKNALIFDSNSLVIFDRIKQLKENDYSIQMIKEKLVAELNIKTKTESETLQNNHQNTQENFLYKELKEMNNRLLVAKDETIQTQKEQIKSLESKILLITDGRSPEQVKQEYMNKEIELKVLQNKSFELEEKFKEEKTRADENRITVALREKELAEQKSKLSLLEIEAKEARQLVIKQEKLVSEKENKLTEMEKSKNIIELELEEQKQKNIEKETKKAELLKKLEDLEGKWFIGAQRKELLKQLNELS